MKADGNLQRFSDQLVLWVGGSLVLRKVCDNGAVKWRTRQLALLTNGKYLSAIQNMDSLMSFKRIDMSCSCGWCLV